VCVVCIYVCYAQKLICTLRIRLVTSKGYALEHEKSGGGAGGVLTKTVILG